MYLEAFVFSVLTKMSPYAEPQSIVTASLLESALKDTFNPATSVRVSPTISAATTVPPGLIATFLKPSPVATGCKGMIFCPKTVFIVR